MVLFAVVMEIYALGENHRLTSLLVSSFRPSPALFDSTPGVLREFPQYTGLN